MGGERTSQQNTGRGHRNHAADESANRGRDKETWNNPTGESISVSQRDGNETTKSESNQGETESRRERVRVTETRERDNQKRENRGETESQLAPRRHNVMMMGGTHPHLLARAKLVCLYSMHQPWQRLSDRMETPPTRIEQTTREQNRRTNESTRPLSKLH